MARILIIDDDEGICYLLSSLVEREGHEVSCAHNLKDGLEEAIPGSFDVVFLDVMMPDGSGLKLLPEILKTASRPEVIIITALGDPEGAELALRNGAWDYLQKPFSHQEIKLLLMRALQYRQARTKKKPVLLLNREGIIGNSPPIRGCLDLVGQAAQSDTSVLITGESGTGKELFAYAIHENSPRHDKNFIVVDCAALPENLVESVLFGHERGAFTGADRPHEGLIRQADGGTLFLDEVGELRLSIQKTFLRVLQEHRFRPVGGKKEIGSDFRLIAATNRNLDQMVQAGKFRQDLFHRIQSMVIGLPPLRERRSDFRELAMYFMNRFCDRHKIANRGFAPEFIEVLAAYDWPGNVRELENSMYSLLTTAGDDPTLFPKHLPIHIRVKVTQDSVKKEEQPLPQTRGYKGPSQAFSNYRDYREKALAAAEKNYLKDLMSLSRGNVKEAGWLSGLSQSRVYALLKKYGISSTSLTAADSFPVEQE
jgi:two-component system NtrC family response regulator